MCRGNWDVPAWSLGGSSEQRSLRSAANASLYQEAVDTHVLAEVHALLVSVLVELLAHCDSGGMAALCKLLQSGGWAVQLQPPSRDGEDDFSDLSQNDGLLRLASCCCGLPGISAPVKLELAEICAWHTLCDSTRLALGCVAPAELSLYHLLNWSRPRSPAISMIFCVSSCNDPHVGRSLLEECYHQHASVGLWLSAKACHCRPRAAVADSGKGGTPSPRARRRSAVPV